MNIKGIILAVAAVPVLGLLAPVAASAAPASSPGSGNACMLNEASGASWNGNFPQGHAAWAFQVGGQWEYGANEGTTWAHRGSWDQLTRDFTGSLVGYHAAGGSYTFKCVTVGSPHPDTAMSTVISQQGQTYVLIFNDCLTNSVDILRAYGVWLPDSAILNPAPNSYYNNSLPGFSAPAAL
jgi:hypothetical protein